MRRAVLIAFFALVAVMPAFAQSSDPSWLEDLNFQIEGQKQCKVAYLIQVREGELGGKKTYEARVQCEDGRMFDAVRVGEFESFKFKADVTTAVDAVFCLKSFPAWVWSLAD